MIRRARLAAPGLLLSILIAPAISLAAEPEWIGGINPGIAKLTYGLYSGGDYRLSFACDRLEKNLVLHLSYQPLLIPIGSPLTLELRLVENDPIILEGTSRRGGFNDPFADIAVEDNFLIEAPLGFEDFQRIAAGGEALEITVEDGIESIPLSGIRGPATAILAACAPDAPPGSEDQEGWSAQGSESWARLVHGTAQHGSLEIFCRPGAAATFHYVPAARAPEGLLDANFSSDAGTLTLDAVLFDDQFGDGDGQVLSGDGDFIAALLPILSEGGTLRIAAGPIDETLPLEGVEEAASLQKAICN